MDYIELKARIEPLDGREIIVAELALLGFESFVDTEEGVQSYIPEVDFDEFALKDLSILKNEEFKIELEINKIESQNWNEVWEQSFDPINVNDKCYIRAPFHPVIPTIEFDIEIEPKMSFGTGHHETTYLMIHRLLEIELTNKYVLDMGCGTAVLAILAEKKGAKNIDAIDIDEWAYNNSLENIRRNNCNKIDVKKGGAEMICDGYDLVIANINRNILLNDMGTYVKALNHSGDLLLSGFFSSDEEILIKEAQKNDLKFLDKKYKNDWTLLHFKKN